MKHLVLLLIFVGALVTSKAADESYSFTYNGKVYPIQVGDTVRLGFGSNPYGSFMYLVTGTSDAPVDKELAGKTAVVNKVRYSKIEQKLYIYMKQGKGIMMYLFSTSGIEQAIAKGEIIGLNEIDFTKE